MEKLDREKTLVIVPLGAVEQHGNQAPLGTDYMIAQEMRKRVVAELNQGKNNSNVLFFPPLPVGFSVEHQSFCGSISFNPETYIRILYEICENLVRHGFKEIAFLICHGGNRATAEIVSRQVRRDYGVFVYLINSGAFDSERVKETISPGNDFDFHGGEMETSMVMAIDEKLVDLDSSEAGYWDTEKNGDIKFFGKTNMPWMGEDFVTKDGKPIGIGGDPSGATKEKGEIIFDESVKEIVVGISKILENM